MREIKFRGRLNSGLCVYGGLVKISEKHSYIIGYFGNPKYSAEEDLLDVKCVCHKVKNETIGQYTGFKDKNIVEIYEGDKVRERAYTESVLEGVVMWYKDRWVVEYSNGLRMPLMYFKWLEVIGNIYENPELLEGE